MNRAWRSLAAGGALVCSMGPLSSATARAETHLAPAGGKPFALPGGLVACEEGIDLHHWTVRSDGRLLQPPDISDATQTRLPVASDRAACSAPTGTVTLGTVARLPVVDASSVTIDLDGGRAWVDGHALAGAVIIWTTTGNGSGGSGIDVCSDVSTTAARTERCAVTLPRGLPADASGLELTVLPAGAGDGRDVTVHDVQGRAIPRAEQTLHPRRVLLARVLSAESTVQFEAGIAHLALLHPEGVASVDCGDATCTIEGAALVVRGEHGTDTRLDLRLHLRPHVFLQTGPSSFDPDPQLVLPIARCPASIASASPLRGLPSQRVVVRVGGACARDPDLQYLAAGHPLPVERTDKVGDETFVVVRLGALEDDELRLSVQRAGTIEAEARTVTIEPPLARTALELPGVGPIDFIPTNRQARARIPVAAGRTILVPLPVPGAYEVSRGPDGAHLIRGLEGAAGSVALRLGLRDPGLPKALRDTDLATFSEPVEHALRTANVPIPLVGAGAGDLVEVVCGDGEGRALPVAPGRTASVPYRARATCRVILHGERVRPEDGLQRLHLGGEVMTVDGERRPEWRLDKTVVLPPHSRVREIAVDGVTAPFDRITVRASSLPGADALAALSDGVDIGDALQWSVVAGRDRARIYATTTIPTGLFRVSDRAHSGILTLNAGGLFRLVGLSRDGTETPVGLEAGAMWLGIPGDGSAAASSRGQIAVVSGIGVGVPIANRGRSSQASISVHAWAEYEVSRSFLREPGSGFGFVFGPSLSIGDVGANF